VQNRLIDLKTFCAACHERGVPVIVDAASVTDPRPYVEAGADFVLFSAHKAFASITAGVIAGRLPLVQACIYQEHGIGRPMKVGKEGVGRSPHSKRGLTIAIRYAAN
jgi:L-seryl-tRNA(Ser) seleniumtransferase